jgi:hypothetical protein
MPSDAGSSATAATENTTIQAAASRKSLVWDGIRFGHINRQNRFRILAITAVIDMFGLIQPSNDSILIS